MLTLASLVFVLIGAVNWFLIGAFEWDFVAAIFGAGSTGARIVYILIGLLALWLIYVSFARRDVINYTNDFNFKRKPRE